MLLRFVGQLVDGRLPSCSVVFRLELVRTLINLFDRLIAIFFCRCNIADHVICNENLKLNVADGSNTVYNCHHGHIIFDARTDVQHFLQQDQR